MVYQIRFVLLYLYQVVNVFGWYCVKYFMLYSNLLLVKGTCTKFNFWWCHLPSPFYKLSHELMQCAPPPHTFVAIMFIYNSEKSNKNYFLVVSLQHNIKSNNDDEVFHHFIINLDQYDILILQGLSCTLKSVGLK